MFIENRIEANCRKNANEAGIKSSIQLHVLDGGVCGCEEEISMEAAAHSAEGLISTNGWLQHD